MNTTLRRRIGPAPALAAMLLAGGVSFAATGTMFFDLGPSKAIYPPQKNPLIFDHAYHVRESDEARGIEGEGMDCDFCHEGLESSETGADRLIPGHDVCELCHDDWIGTEDEPAEVADCARCHGDLDPNDSDRAAAPMRIAPPNIVFGHAPHLRAGAACLDCHPNVPKKRLATRDDLPTMDRCIDCHTEASVSVACRTCHLGAGDGRIRTAYPSGQLKPRRYHTHAIHDATFLRDHAIPAKRERDYCETCHDHNDCMRCHDGIGRDARYHPDAWMAQHSLRAKKNDFRCESCHRAQSFCLNCHLRSGVATFGSSPAVPLQRRTIRLSVPSDRTSPAVGPHPMAANGWLDPTSRNFHGFHAQRNIRACAGCHQENYCIQCHGSAFGGRGPRGVSPHGPNPERLRGSLAARQNARACLKCHSPADPSWR